MITQPKPLPLPPPPPLSNSGPSTTLTEDAESNSEDVFVVADEFEDQLNHSKALSLAGLVLVGKPYRKQAITEALISAWNTSHPVIVSPIKNHTYLFRFEHAMDVQNVLTNAPWSVAGNLLILERWKPARDWSFAYTDIWVQFHEILEELQDYKLVSRLVMKVGDVSRLMDITGVRSGKRLQYFKARLKLDVRKPLKDTIQIRRRSGEKHSVDLRYERLPLFYYYCGLIGHNERCCQTLFEDEQKHKLTHQCPHGTCPSFTYCHFQPYLRCPTPDARLLE
ncbi:uncharacterized protein LOC122082259 [Macadamia integrifolia]|uniref:uncharacterized protein LOC122082259 n=1 Tax=Macadamia integrifolia TaxID=60698 RepID=UPI001C4FF684|nr:uncharacterized protein LOC122082259 [Macadamia integrifolia]